MVKKQAPTVIRYTDTHLTQFVFPDKQKTFKPSVSLLGRALFMIIEKQKELYGPHGADWVKRYIFEVVQSGTSPDDAEQYIKKNQ